MRQLIQKRAGIIMLVVLCCTCLLTVSAFAAGLDATCRSVQKQVQASVGDEAGYKNHGQYVNAAAKIVDAAVTSGQIDSVCASCIMNQFARSIPIAEQTPCGPDSPNPECTGAQCGTFTACNAPNSCGNPICASTSDGGGVCVEGNTPCAGLTLCPNGASDCPAGNVCVVNTCCGEPVCIPPDAFCTPGAAPASAAIPQPGVKTVATPGN